jgi:hypothetical protein
MRFVANAAVAAVAALTIHTSAEACALVCSQTVNATEITQPAFVTFRLEVSCPQVGHYDYIASLASSFELPGGTLLPAGYVAGLFPIGGVGTSGVQVWYGAPVVREYDVGLDYQTCLQQPGAVVAADGTVTISNNVTGSVYWWENTLNCPSPPIVCRPPVTGTGATRTIGFWKTHVQALERCLAGGVDLGFGPLTREAALGLLWANPSQYSGLQRETILLGRQLLAAACNVSQFGAAPSEFSVAGAIGLITSANCSAMRGLYPKVDAFNNLNDNTALPFDPGPSIGVGARALAGDPGLPAGACAP